jgi:hypothetical protein
MQQFNGLKNVGGKKNNQHKATLSWLVNLVAADGNAANVNVPGFATIDGWSFLLDPTSVQSSFTYGDGKALQISVQRASSTVVDATHFYTSGRTFVYIVSTGQLFVLGSKPPSVGAPPLTGQPVQTETCIVPCDAIQPGHIIVFIEADNQNGAIVTPGNMSFLAINVTLFNYEVAPLAAI